MSLNVCFILMIYLVCHFILQVAAYDTKVNKMAFFDPSRAKDFLFISGTKVYIINCSLICFRTNQPKI